MNENTIIQEQIINMLNTKKKCVFGEIVRDLNFSYNDVLTNVIELKKNGKITKSAGDDGYYVTIT
ncbi:MAG: hypothetical protein MI922_10995 [Bacteroidales bacterium]|nr:hypothetical protein [Bacteroidales bacterium]